jgi:4-aminobutyrate aminotransferase-like enzyme|tara:strand:+ start:14764 stop:15183 length:420 start_codon:yes stop_codon:yes gene_type:complete
VLYILGFTTSEIAAAFNNGVSYFNTFGGNPVSCIAGLAVLDILDGENLLANVSALSEKLFLRLRELQDKYDCIADVRGLGLYVGVELSKMRKRLEKINSIGVLKNDEQYRAKSKEIDDGESLLFDLFNEAYRKAEKKAK